MLAGGGEKRVADCLLPDRDTGDVDTTHVVVLATVTRPFVLIPFDVIIVRQAETVLSTGEIFGVSSLIELTVLSDDDANVPTDSVADSRFTKHVDNCGLGVVLPPDDESLELDCDSIRPIFSALAAKLRACLLAPIWAFI